MGLTGFDLLAGAILLVSGLMGFARGATREVTGAAAFVLALLAAFAALRFSAPLAHRVFATPWVAKWAAVIAGFLLVYVLLRAAFGALVRGVRSAGLSSLDRALGAAVGLTRGVVAIGLAALLLDTVMPADRAPAWLAGARLYPLAEASGHMLRGLAPVGQRLAGEAAPMLRQAPVGLSPAPRGAPSRRGLDVLVEKER